jgi:hypothetical protein
MFPIKSIVENDIPSLRHSHCLVIHNVAYESALWNKWQVGSQEELEAEALVDKLLNKLPTDQRK